MQTPPKADSKQAELACAGNRHLEPVEGRAP